MAGNLIFGERMNQEMTIGQIGNMVCRELPYTWELEIHLENGSASVNLFNPIGEKKPFEIYDCTLEDAVIEAVNYAKNHLEDF